MSSKAVALVLWYFVSLLLVSCSDDNGGEAPAPLLGSAVNIFGRVTTSSGAAVSGASIHVIYEGIGESDSPDNIAIDLANSGWVTLKVYDIRGNEEATLVDGMMSSGRHTVAINPDAFYNGAHQLRFEMWTTERDSLLYSSSRWWLKNISDPNVLNQAPPAATTNSSGHFDFYTAAGLTIEILNEWNQLVDSVSLNRVTILALCPDDRPPNYTPVWQTVDVDSGQRLAVNFIAPDVPVLPPGIVIRIGDTTYVVPDSAQQLADSGFSRNAYLLREYQIATDPQFNPTPYAGSLGAYRNEPWDIRRLYLENAVPFVHDLVTADTSEYYDWISRFPAQFGFGWKDTYRANANVTDPPDPQLYIWDNPSDPTNTPDDPNTSAFDGTSHLLERYRAMWIRIPG